MTPIEGYELAKQDIKDYVASGRELIAGSYDRGTKHCALGVLRYHAGSIALLRRRYDGARLSGLVDVNDYVVLGIVEDDAGPGA